MLFQQRVLHNKNRPTKRAPDVWDSAAFSSIFLASGFSCSQTLSTPAHLRVTQTVRCFAEKQNQEQRQIRFCKSWNSSSWRKSFFCGGFGSSFSFVHFGSVFGTAPCGQIVGFPNL